MRSQNAVRSALGMTQQAMADLLNVTRVQWALYECGQRSLPRHAVKLLTTITTDVHSKKLDGARDHYHREQSLMRYERLERVLLEVDFKYAVLQKNVAVWKKRQDEIEKLSLTAEMISAYRHNKSIAPEWPLVTPRLPSKKERMQFENKLLDFELEMEGLELKKLLIQSRIRKLSKTLDFTSDNAKEADVS